MKSKLAAVVLTAILGASCTLRDKDCTKSTYEIPVGNIEKICQIESSTTGRDVISYSGMPNKDVFSLGYGNQNFFFPVESGEFRLQGTLKRPSHKFKVDQVSPTSIIFTYENDILNNP